ncbi:hypothetical protein ABPG75_006101 [Micractinium tetrahymenae]
MNVNVFIDQVVVQAGGQQPSEAARGGIEGAGAATAVAAAPAGPCAAGGPAQQPNAQNGSREQASGEPPYWDSTGPREPLLEEGSAEWRLARRPAQTNEQDEGTPDEWVHRHPDMIRLTSKHPLNAEPPLGRLLAAGFHTPASLHYVRNHGAVPRLTWAEHRLEITGLVERPCQLSMQELTERFAEHGVLATLSCAGNRRREVQLVARTQGFAWGHSAIATTEWAGARLCDVLEWVGVKKGASFIHFSGPPGEVAGGDGTYATSIPLWKGQDRFSEVLLAWRHNGRLMQPDHGYPLRVVIPGYIGGRCVKWLTRIELSSEESRNHYHQQDNKVLPPDVDQERANRENWWVRPQYVCYNLNIGSIIAAPAHDEVLPLPAEGEAGGSKAGSAGDSSSDGDSSGSYTLRGFAHTGAGHLIIRVELSLDGGDSWRQAGIAEREPGRAATDKNWCWVLWEAQIPVADLAAAEEIHVRAFDETMNTQPEKPSWNLIGMMNNSHFIVKIRKEHVEGPNGRRQLRFLHPVANGRDPGGWMVEEKRRREGGDAEAGGPNPEQEKEEAASSIKGKGWDQLREYGWEEIRQHTSRDSCWFVRDGRVYDATPFLSKHPGGAAAILGQAGRDASDEFDPIHSSDAREMTLQYLIGKLKGAQPPFRGVSARQQGEQAQGGAAPAKQQQEAEEEDEPALRKGKVLKARLAEKEVVTHDTRIFRFALPRKDQRLGLPVGHHITVTAEIKGEKVIRPYTPVTLDHERGHFNLCIKVYFAGEDPKHPEGGKMSQHMDRLQIGDTIDVRGPFGEFTYLGGGRFTHQGREGRCRRINLLGGGTGITPLYQVMRAVMEDEADSTQLCLLFANKTEADILLRQRLQEASERYQHKLRVWYTLDKSPGDSWHYSVGIISKDMVQEHMFPADNTTGTNDGKGEAQGDSTGPVEGGGGGEAKGGGEAAAGQAGGGKAEEHSSEAEGQPGKAAGGRTEGDGSGTAEKGGGGSKASESGGGSGGPPQASGASSGAEAQRQGGSSGAGQAPGGAVAGGGDGGTVEHTGEQGKGQHDDGRSGGGTIALVCGPPPMVDRACLPALRELGFDEQHIVVF